MFIDQHRANVAHATGNHDGFVITLKFMTGAARCRLLKAAKITGDIRTAKFIIKSGTAQGAIEHNI